MSEVKLLDLFCCAGGAAMGYYQAGFTDITGIDIKPQPHYPFKFIQADALEYLAAHGHEYDVIHASPPCQHDTNMRHLGKARNKSYPEHPDLIPPTRELLYKTGKPFVLENVRGASKKMSAGLMLCGAQFGLHVYRHRLFESNVFFWSLPHKKHADTCPSAGNGISPKGFISVCGMGGVKGMTEREIVAYWSFAMGIDWMNRDELREAIPPAYTRFIGERLMAQLQIPMPLFEENSHADKS